MSVLIVGASVAGVRTLQALRANGYDGAITLVGEEPHRPYDKPPLSKEMLDPCSDGDPVPLLTDEDLTALDAELRLGVRAVALDPHRRRVSTDDGERLGYDHLVLATGVKPRTLPGGPDLAGVYTLRDLADAQALRAELAAAKQVVVIGAGFIGAEFASAAVQYGHSVTVIEAQQTPMSHLLGAEVGAQLARLHALNGVTVLAGSRFAHFVGQHRIRAVALADGRVVPADLVVVGIGTRPATGWLAGSGLGIGDGIACDDNLQVHGFTGVYAAGDVALRRHARDGAAQRIEHWTNAGEHGAVVAAHITGSRPPTAQPPYVWSDQYGKRIQIVGRPAAGKPVTQVGSVEGPRWAVVYADPHGSTVGALVIDDPQALMACRKAVRTGCRAADLDIDTTRTALTR